MALVNIPRNSAKWLLAEMLVVILGILIAFQVEELRSHLNEKEEERITLEAIARDLELGQSELELWEESLQSNMSYLNSLVSHISNPGVADVKSIENILGLGFRSRLWAPTSPAFTGMRDSGKLGLITDPALQTQIVRYFDIVEPYMLELRIGLHKSVDTFLDALFQDTKTVPASDFNQTHAFEITLIVSPMEFPTHPDFTRLLKKVYTNTQFALHVIRENKKRLRSIHENITIYLGEQD